MKFVEFKNFLKVKFKPFSIIALKVLMWFFVAVFVIISSLIVYVYYNQDKIKNILIKEINSNLIAEVKVSEVDISVLKKFPFVSLVFHDVKIPEVVNGKSLDTYFVVAEKVFLQFNIRDILKSNYRLRRISVDNSTCNIRYFEDGSDNFTFWKTDSTKTESEFSLHLNQLYCNNLALNFSDHNIDIKFLLDIHNIKLSGNFYNEDFDLKFNSDFNTNYFISENDTVFNNLPINADGIINVSLVNKELNINRLNILAKEVPLFLSGKINYFDNLRIDLKAENSKCKISDIFDLLPENINKNFENFDKKGNAKISIETSGYFKPNSFPSLKAEIEIENSRFVKSKPKLIAENINFHLNFFCPDLKNIQNSEVLCKKFNAKINNGFINGNFTLRNLINSSLNLNLEANLNLEDLFEFFPNENIDFAKGNVELSINLKSSFKDIRSIEANDFLDSESNGFIKSKSLKLKFLAFAHEFSLTNLNAKFNNKDLIINALDILISNSDFNVSGTAFNVFPFMLGKENNLSVHGKLFSKKIDTNILFNGSTNTKTPEDDTFIQFPDFLYLNLDAEIKDIVYQKFTAKNIKTKLILNNRVLLLRDISMETMDGKIDAELIIDTKKPEKFDVKVLANLKNVSVSKIFIDFENFGQNSLTDKNLSGTLSGTVHAVSSWKYNLEVDPNSINVVSDFELKNGSLKNYEPIAGLEKYIKRRNFRDINFETLSNQIVIQNQEILIPKMSIRSSAMNFELSGKHKFSNEIEYNMKILLSDLRTREERVRQNRAEDVYGTIEEDDIDRKANWAFKVVGTVDNPKFIALDIQAVRTNISTEVKAETVKIKDLIKNEFNTSKDTTDKIIFHKEGEKPKLLIEWDDD